MRTGWCNRAILKTRKPDFKLIYGVFKMFPIKMMKRMLLSTEQQTFANTTVREKVGLFKVNGYTFMRFDHFGLVKQML